MMALEGLDDVASQTSFARLVGVSQQAISKQIEKGVLARGGSIREWMLAYCDHLREQAAGRGGDLQSEVARSKIEESRVKAALGRLQYQEKLDQVVHKQEARAFLSDWAGYANREFRQSVERLMLDIQNQFDVDVPDELREKHAGTAIERIKRYARKLGSDGAVVSGDVSAPEADTDGAVD